MRDLENKQDRKGDMTTELKRLWREGIDSDPGRFSSMDEIKTEARRRFEMTTWDRRVDC